MIGVIRVVSPQPMVPLVLLPPAGLPHVSKSWLWYYKYKYKCVCVCVGGWVGGVCVGVHIKVSMV